VGGPGVKEQYNYFTRKGGKWVTGWMERGQPVGKDADKRILTSGARDLFYYVIVNDFKFLGVSRKKGGGQRKKEERGIQLALIAPE